MSNKSVLVWLFAAGAMFLPVQAQSTIWVDTAAPGCDDAGPGSPGVPKCMIQAGVDAAVGGDEVRVRPGMYNECVVALAGVAIDIVADAFVASDPNTAALTTIDGTSVGDCTFDETPTGIPAAVVAIGHNVTLTGFRITGGTRSGVYGLGSITITSNIVEDNSATRDGGGIYVYSGNCFYGDTTTVVENNQIRNNVSDRFGGGLSVSGGLQPIVEDPNCTIDGNATMTIQGNTIEDNASVNEGGGIMATTYTNGNRTATIVITQSMIRGNTSSTVVSYGYGGGLYAKTYGYGTESIEISQNTFTDNQSTFDGGGGLSAFIVPQIVPTVDHTITIDGNTVSGNRAGLGGGGIELVVSAEGLALAEDAHLVATGNTVTGNQVTSDNPNSTLGGGGIEARLFAVTSTSPNVELRVEGNQVTQNSSKVFGGGITAFTVADGQIEDDLGNPISIAPAAAEIELIQNQITENSARSLFIGSAGAGVFVYLGAQGQATSTVTAGLNSIVGNTLDNSTNAGGIDVEVELTTDDNAIEGQAALVVNGTIVADNDGVEMGGPVPGSSGLVTDGGGTGLNTSKVQYSDFYDGAGNDLASWIVPGSNNLFVDPVFADRPTGIHLRPESPLIDQGDPVLPAWAPATDPDGDIRVSDGNNDTIAVVEIGADELWQCLDVDFDHFTPDTVCGPPGIVDCDDAEPAVYPGATQICDGLNNDCDDAAWPALTGIEVDDDLDGYTECEDDCDDANDTVYLGATEVNDGIDNHCPGDIGYLAVDENAGASGFRNPTRKNEYSWDVQIGATAYEVARSMTPTFSVDCVSFATLGTHWVDGEDPPPGVLFHYLNRPIAPNVGSWGRTSWGVERAVICPSK